MHETIGNHGIQAASRRCAPDGPVALELPGAGVDVDTARPCEQRRAIEEIREFAIVADTLDPIYVSGRGNLPHRRRGQVAS